MSHHKSRLSRKRIRRNCTCFSKVHPRAPVKDKKVWFLHKLLKSSSLWMRFPPTKRKIFSLSFCFGKQHEIFAWNVFFMPILMSKNYWQVVLYANYFSCEEHEDTVKRSRIRKCGIFLHNYFSFDRISFRMLKNNLNIFPLFLYLTMFYFPFCWKSVHLKRK